MHAYVYLESKTVRGKSQGNNESSLDSKNPDSCLSINQQKSPASEKIRAELLTYVFANYFPKPNLIPVATLNRIPLSWYPTHLVDQTPEPASYVSIR